MHLRCANEPMNGPNWWVKSQSGLESRRINMQTNARTRGGSLRCGDPECAPIDTVVRIMFDNQCGCVLGIPCEAYEVEESDLDETMPPTEMFHEWKVGLNTRTGEGDWGI